MTAKQFKDELNSNDINMAADPEQSAYRVIIDQVRNELLKISNAEDEKEDRKKAYYFSMEWLPGPMLKAYLESLGWDQIVHEVMDDLGLDYDKMLSNEPDPKLGSGGLGRLASCFLDSAAQMDCQMTGMGIRFNCGLFKQTIVNNEQVELPDVWQDEYGRSPFEICRRQDAVPVHFGGEVSCSDDGLRTVFSLKNANTIQAIPYDMPVMGSNGRVNYLTLWKAEAPADLDALNHGDFEKLKENKALELINDYLYPNDSVKEGRQLRLTQEYLRLRVY